VKKSKKRALYNFPLLALVILLLALAIGLFYYRYNLGKLLVIRSQNSNQLSEKDYERIRDGLVTIVKIQNPKLALNKLRGLISDNAVANSCHGLAHEIGHASYKKYLSLDKALEFNDEICGSGYIHGAVEERMDNVSNIYSELTKVCAPQNQGICFHGVGHGFMYYTNNNLPKSLQLCDLLSQDYGRINCYDGVFMENFEGDHFLHPSTYLRKSDPLYPCRDQKDAYKDSCYFYAPRFYLQINNGDYVNALSWCANAESGYKLTCIKGVGSGSMKQNLNDPKYVEKICLNAKSNTELNYCIDGMVSYYITNFYSLNAGKNMCGLLSKSNQQSCFASVKKRQNLFPN